MKAEFVKSASAPAQFPAGGLPEIAFVGRSNVGKSSLINTLTGLKGLAFTSNTPGRTQTINFYRVGGKLFFVDLPGYGYARVPKAITDGWKPFIEHYLLQRPELELAFIVLDSRRGWMDKDLDLKAWMEHRGLPYVVVATKMDKLNRTEQNEAVERIAQLAPNPIPFSATTGRGVREIWQAISKTLKS